MVCVEGFIFQEKESLDAIRGEEVGQTKCQKEIKMDVIKTSLIIAIGITFYYLLLQWPNQVDNYEVSTNYTNESIEFGDCLLYTSPSPRD